MDPRIPPFEQRFPTTPSHASMSSFHWFAREAVQDSKLDHFPSAQEVGIALASIKPVWIAMAGTPRMLTDLLSVRISDLIEKMDRAVTSPLVLFTPEGARLWHAFMFLLKQVEDLPEVKQFKQKHSDKSAASPSPYEEWPDDFNIPSTVQEALIRYPLRPSEDTVPLSPLRPNFKTLDAEHDEWSDTIANESDQGEKEDQLIDDELVTPVPVLSPLPKPSRPALQLASMSSSRFSMPVSSSPHRSRVPSSPSQVTDRSTFPAPFVGQKMTPSRTFLNPKPVLNRNRRPGALASTSQTFRDFPSGSSLGAARSPTSRTKGPVHVNAVPGVPVDSPQGMGRGVRSKRRRTAEADAKTERDTAGSARKRQRNANSEDVEDQDGLVTITDDSPQDEAPSSSKCLKPGQDTAMMHDLDSVRPNFSSSTRLFSDAPSALFFHKIQSSTPEIMFPNLACLQCASDPASCLPTTKGQKCGPCERRGSPCSFSAGQTQQTVALDALTAAGVSWPLTSASQTAINDRTSNLETCLATIDALVRSADHISETLVVQQVYLNLLRTQLANTIAGLSSQDPDLAHTVALPEAQTPPRSGRWWVSKGVG
ncbi:hypothetical protein NMY22_g3716 [Coprinellus aureogranulatus]|nr:hypothetical protein NMY22_g3716 [Coprinellus aureogranulatus]